VIFDNVQALLLGDMREEEPWQQTLPWVRDLTHRCIGQLWVHHTGHVKTHAYGTKTREWQLDTVMLGEKAENEDADIAFTLTFTKARERSPDNRNDFAKVVITLADDEWRVSGAPLALTSRGRVSPLAVKFHEALLDAIARPGEPDGHGPG